MKTTFDIMYQSFVTHSVSENINMSGLGRCRMRSLKKTVLLAILVSVVLVLALIHSWPARAYTTVDVWQQLAPVVERNVEDRLPLLDHQLSNIPFHVKTSVAR